MFCPAGPISGRLSAPSIRPRRREHQVQRLYPRRHSLAAAAVGPTSLTCRRTYLELPVSDGNISARQQDGPTSRERNRPTAHPSRRKSSRRTRSNRRLPRRLRGAPQLPPRWRSTNGSITVTCSTLPREAKCQSYRPMTTRSLYAPEAELTGPNAGWIAFIAVYVPLRHAVRRQSQTLEANFEANAYQATPEKTSKGLIRNIYENESPADIVSNLATQRNPGVLHAKRMGNH
ncbi:hypothetical protein HPB52_021736 [Rhipicephalus sanguineus]|uniref:Uncharacterized protein n=1 Tax=Rhipicephalus sanguineus TaxID=34632 RepID=A0A9D4Q8D0_RHISA|nr:hypothetical protein HPB52_021736 [Rhipicephalus sanguineus]